jgi:hypothetical protein
MTSKREIPQLFPSFLQRSSVPLHVASAEPQKLQHIAVRSAETLKEVPVSRGEEGVSQKKKSSIHAIPWPPAATLYNAGPDYDIYYTAWRALYSREVELLRSPITS